MLRINNITLPIGYTDKELKAQIISKLHCIENDIIDFKIFKISVDARKKPNLKYNASVIVKLKYEQKFENVPDVSVYQELTCELLDNPKKLKNDIRPIIVGSGPAGMFCALALINNNIKPIVIEQGECVEERIKSVNSFFNGGTLNTSSNIQFGEGGAGTFSDGKINTGINDPYCYAVIKQFFKYGANSDILTDARPHIGTDYLVKIVRNIRKAIIDAGGEYFFNTKMTEILTKNNSAYGIEVISRGVKREILSPQIILAIGHSARDTFYMLDKKGMNITAKPFSMGVRIEHLQESIDKAQYGDYHKKLNVPPSEYKLSALTSEGRCVYTFCMCPGGFVVASASEDGCIVTNGMSNFKRDGKNANSAVLINVTPEDYKGNLGGIELQRIAESKAYNISKSYKAPAQLVGDFFKDKATNEFKSVIPTYRPNVIGADLRECLPSFVTNSIKEGLKLFNNKINGFADYNAVLTGVETRSSSPVRLVRDEISRQSNITNIYPIGEGAGYSGGIMSSAVDGLHTAEALLKVINK